VKNNSYMNDILDSVSSKENACQTAKEIETVVKAGGFEMKSWVVSGESANDEDIHFEQIADKEKALGVSWDPIV
jgi:hypothetical protein